MFASKILIGNVYIYNININIVVINLDVLDGGLLKFLCSNLNHTRQVHYTSIKGSLQLPQPIKFDRQKKTQ